MVKVTHIITGLNVGGAEMMLYKLLAYSDRVKYPSEVISLTDIGPIGKKIQELNVPVYEVGLHRGISGIMGFMRMVRIIRNQKPDIVQTWMYHADVVGGIATVLSGRRVPVVWNIRLSSLDSKFSKRSTILLGRISALLSHWLPKKILLNSESAKPIHEKMGYDKTKMIVIPNGFDLSEFHPDADAKISIREELKVSKGTPLIGYIARFDPQKDHHTFIQAAKLLNISFPDVHFVLSGREIDWDNKQLVSWIEVANLRNSFHLLGERDDIPRITAALDIASLTSVYGEGFPNILGEAMASGVPCVSTAVGDVANIIGDTGVVVTIKDSKGIADGWAKILRMRENECSVLSRRAIEHITQEFSIDSIVKRYYNLYREICLKR